MEDGTWKEYRLMILNSMNTISDRQQKHQQETREDFQAVFNKLNKIETELEGQKTKTSLIGAFWGAVTGLATAIVAALKSTG